jgi:hypothetical protein
MGTNRRMRLWATHPFRSLDDCVARDVGAIERRDIRPDAGTPRHEPIIRRNIVNG